MDSSFITNLILASVRMATLQDKPRRHLIPAFRLRNKAAVHIRPAVGRTVDIGPIYQYQADILRIFPLRLLRDPPDQPAVDLFPSFHTFSS